MTASSEQFGQTLVAARAALARGDRAEAGLLLREAIDGAHRAGVDETMLVPALIELAALERDRDDLQAAEALHRRALTVLDGADAPDETLLVATLMGLGGVLAAQGDTSQAERLLSRALAISEVLIGSDHADLAGLLNDLSRLLLKSAAYAAAEPLLLRLYDIKRRSKGEDHPEAATVLASLATVRQGLGRHDEAETMWRRVLEVRERSLAPNHFATATALEHLAESCAARGKLPEALQLMKRAAAMRELTLGPSHPSLRVSRDRIADLQLQASDDAMEGFTPPISRPATIPYLSAPVAASVVARAPAASAAPAAAPAVARAAAPEPVPAIHTASPPRGEKGFFVPQQRADAAESESRPQQAFVLPASSGALALQEQSVARVPEPAVVPAHEGLMSIQAELAAAGHLDEYEETDEPRSDRVRAYGVAALTMLQQRRVPVAITGGIAAVLLLATVATRSRAATDVGGRAGEASATAASTSNLSSATLVTATTPLATAATGATLAAAPAPATVARVAPAVGDPRLAAARARTIIDEVTPRESRPAAPAAPRLLSNLDSFARSMKTPGVPVEDSYRVKLASDAPKSASDPMSIEGAGELVRAQLIGAVPQPKFPEILRDRQIDGQVVVRFTVDAKGLPDLSSITVLRSPHDLLTETVRRAVPSMRFQPAHRARIGSPNEPDQVQIAFQFSNGAK